MFRNFFKDESGLGMVEYGLIIALIAVVVLVALKALGGSVNDIFGDAAESIADPSSIPAPTN